MLIGERIKTYFSGPRRIRRVVLGIVGATVLVLAIVFSQDIEHLWQWLRGEAAILGWTTHSEQLVKEISHAKTIVIDHPDGKRYLYALGGLEQYSESGENRLRLLDNVQRIELDKTTGKIKEMPQQGGGTISAKWEGGTNPASDAKWMHMYSGHAEFGLIYLPANKSLYVISGDIHIPDVSNSTDDIYNPLLFSTIEKLDLTSTATEATGWQAVGIVTGVNFYPEVKIFDNTLHIVGGVYGNIFGKYVAARKWYDNNYDVKDPLLPDDDKNKWVERFKGLRSEGRMLGDMDVSLKGGSLGDNIIAGHTGPIIGVPGTGSTVGFSMSDQVWIQQVIPSKQNLADTLSKALLSGNFATTVSEHYTINLQDFTNQHVGELGIKEWSQTAPGHGIESGGNDYTGKLSSTWSTGINGRGVVHISHLRIVLELNILDVPSGYYYYIYPAPQGRYGHQLVEFGSQYDKRLYVLGGASWSAPVYRSFMVNSVVYRTNIYHFWVLEDIQDPITNEQLYPDSFYDYQFLGNRSYEWSPGSNPIWKGTNPVSNVSRFDETKFTPLSGAFVGLAEMHPKPNVIEFVAVGGLANDNSQVYESGFPWNLTIPSLCHEGSDWGVSVKVSGRLKQYSYEDNAWQDADALSDSAPAPSFGASAVGMGGYAIAFGGQTTFQGSGAGSATPFNDDFVPDPGDAITTQTRRYDTFADGHGVWSALGDINLSTAFYALGEVVSEDGATSAKTIYLYKLGGSASASNSVSSGVEFIGPFIYGIPGVVDPTQSTLEIVPLRTDASAYRDVDVDGKLKSVPVVWNDHYDYATATLTLKDYYGTPVTGGGLAATLYTTRSILPAIDKYGPPENRLEDIRIIGTATEGTNWPAAWQDQVVAVDAQGQAKFRILSGMVTDTNITQPYISVYGYAVNTNSAYDSGQDKVGAAQLIFTREGHPSANYSNLVADPSVVRADGINVSNLTATVKDYKNEPLPGFKVNLTSNRNEVLNPDPDQFGAAELTPDQNGEASTTVKSALRGLSQVKGYYTIPGHTDLPNAPDLPNKRGYKTVVVKFTLDGRIISLVPASGKQTQSLDPLTARGEDVLWKDDATEAKYNTKAEFITPAGPFELADGSDINTYYLSADGVTITKFVVNSLQAGEQINLEITEGGGYFMPTHSSTATISANTAKKAYFQYEASDTAGILKIKATFNSNGSSRQLWLPLLEDDGYYDMELTADPNTLNPTNGNVSAVTAVPKNFDLPIPNADVTWGTTPAVTDDDGNISGLDFTPINNNANLRFNYQQIGSQNGTAHIFVIASYQTKKIVGMVPINKNFDTASNNIITFNSPATIAIDPVTGIDNQFDLTMVNGIKIGEYAPTGAWIFKVITTVNEEILGLPGQYQDIDYVETAIFMVIDKNLPSGAYIDKIDPNRGYRNETLPVVITGINTHFVDSPGPAQSQVTFTPITANAGNPGSATGVTATVVDNAPGNSETQLTVNVKISADAKFGYWDVVVNTGAGAEIAELLGDRDFLVTTPEEDKGYFVDLVTDHDSLPRDGKSTAELTATVGHIDESDGIVDYLDNQTVAFGWLIGTSDDGSLDPVTKDTGIDGKAKSTYKVDADPADGSVTIQASVVDISPGITVTGTATIKKTGQGSTVPNADQSEIWTNSPKPIDSNGDGEPNCLVIVTVRDSLGGALKNKQVTLAVTSSDHTGNVIKPPATQTTNDAGEVFYQVSSSNPGLTEVTATIGTVSPITKKADIRFEPEGILTEHTFKVIAPFQNRDYDNWVLVKIKDKTASAPGDLNFSETYLKEPRPPAANADVITALKSISFHLYQTRTYAVWAKGKNHLSVANYSVAPGSNTEIAVSFASANNNKGLPIGDIATASNADTIFKGGFHDNVIGKVIPLPLADDILMIVSNAFRADVDLPDLNDDGMVNVGDVIIGINNLGVGAPAP